MWQIYIFLNVTGSRDVFSLSIIIIIKKVQVENGGLYIRYIVHI